MKIGIASDHGAYSEKLELIKHLETHGYEIVDFGGYTGESIDYPDTALPLCSAVANREVERGIAMCGTGIGMSIMANKVKGIRCAHCTDSCSARLTRLHNDSNVLALGARITGIELIKDIATVWLETEFSGDERHLRRINKITGYEDLR